MKINEQPGKFTGPAELRMVRTLPGPIDRVWQYVTDPEKRARWLAGGTMEPRVGGKMRLDFRQKNLAPNETPPDEYKQHHDPGHAIDCVVTRYEPPHVLAFTFGSDGESIVTIELTPQDRSVLLVLTHRATGGDIPYMDSFGAGWHTHFAYLIGLLEGAPITSFWSLYSQLRVEYDKARVAAQQG